ncbi:CASP8 and FADD-like apoptosis regulator isoform X3 [Rhineura floridana]|uniref:CASP8 and FADD-like apoptosis regulator isoform X3 n=1 Tax=Rhineura floridana TaxID=261503 RepID=UPI002AC81657|nr:CASP8 and FADD-like apoptosis regulator isoform X3 [Rhineura floridana]
MTWLFCLNNAEDFLKGQWLVMTVYRVPAALLHQIEQELDAEEKETMLFLCRDLVPDLPAANVRKLLVALNEREMLTPVSLSELLYRMKRFDLLKKVLGTGRTAVEASLPRCPQMLSKYRVLMTEINEDLDKEDLSSLVFLLMNDLGTSHVKAAKEKVVNKGRLTNGACAIQAEQIHISVPETGGAQAQVSNKYRMQSQPLGVCLIIDCIGNDAGMLTVTFKALCFEVRCCLFPNVDSLVRELYEVARLKQHKDYDCFVCILVSRGNHQGIFCTNPIVPGFSLERLKNFFTGDACPYLSGKPKLFFIQNYVEPGTWQENPSLLEADGDLCTIPQGADVLWSLSMLNASNMERSQSSSSYYLSALTELLIDPHKRKLHLLDILVELNSKIYEWNRTNPRDQYSVLLKHTLRKKLFLSVS